MPYTVNGVGTHVCGSRGNVGFNSYDAMEWVVFFFMPVIPLKAYHTYDWNGDQFRYIPIKWSFDLVFRTFFTGWNWGLLCAGFLFAFIGAIMASKNEAPAGLMLLLSVLSFGACAMVFVVLRYTGERDRNIRRVLGPHPLGSVDLVLLPDDLVEQIAGDPKEHYGKSSYADAVPDLLEGGSYHQAMWAARLCAAVEDRRTGEELTDLILSDPDVRDALAAVKKDPNKWDRNMLSPEERRQAKIDDIRKV